MLEAQVAVVRSTTLLVLDEADVLLSLGFAPQLSSILGQLRPDRQTLLFSATLPPALEEAAAGWATFASQTQGASPRPPSP
mmetsp:Transcript_12979/g.41618  ORF Transcript_12979/g.41618 Transcript_12979/m.41618 type:complete len:81 (+) Transcript_12979:743-985(+)